jgi:uncharacterized membrane protein HdeD (DUF308 family)
MTTSQPVPSDPDVPGSDRGPPGGPGSAPLVPRWAYVVFLIRGVVALALGIAMLAAGSNFNRLTTFVGIYWVVAALLTLHWVSTHRTQPHRRLGALAGTVGLVAGAAVVLRPLLDALLDRGVLLDLLGASAIATGLFRLLGTFHDDQLAGARPRRRYRFVLGGLEVLLGLTLVTASEAASEEIRLALALWGLSTGTFLLLDALMLRRLTRSGAVGGS